MSLIFGCYVKTFILSKEMCSWYRGFIRADHTTLSDEETECIEDSSSVIVTHRVPNTCAKYAR